MDNGGRASEESFRLLIDACRNSVPALPVLVYTMSVITLLSSSAIYLVESRENIPSSPENPENGNLSLQQSLNRLEIGELTCSFEGAEAWKWF